MNGLMRIDINFLLFLPYFAACDITSVIGSALVDFWFGFEFDVLLRFKIEQFFFSTGVYLLTQLYHFPNWSVKTSNIVHGVMRIPMNFLLFFALGFVIILRRKIQIGLAEGKN